MSAAQNHHYLPQSYQRGWADANGRVWVYRWRHDKLICSPKVTRATGGRPGLYYIPMAPPDRRNFMEAVFWRQIDQWGADGLQRLRDRASGPLSPRELNRLAIFLLSLELRNPRKIAEIEAEAKKHVLESSLGQDYDRHRRPHHPATLAEFKAALDQPGLTEHGADLLRSLTLNQPVRERLTTMDWQVVTVQGAEPILTSDAPLIRYRGLEHDDGMWLLPTASEEFLAIFNHGQIDMVRSIERNIQDGVFVTAINKYVVRNRIDYVYGADDSQMDFVKRFWAVSEAGNA